MNFKLVFYRLAKAETQTGQCQIVIQTNRQEPFSAFFKIQIENKYE